MKINLPLLVDQYKMNSHFKIMPDNVTGVYSYMEARKGARYDKILFFGLQYYIKHYLLQPVTMEDVDFAEKVANNTNFHKDPFNREGWEYIVNELDGKLPIRIKAVPEGTIVDVDNVIMTIENTDEKCAWLTNYVETLLMKLWYPLTLAFRSNKNVNIIKDALERTSMLESSLAEHLYIDFGYRGVTSEEQAAIGGASHLLSNFGSDTIAGTRMLLEYYNNGMFGEVGSISYGVPASEHSIATSRGEEGELDYYLDMLLKFPDGLVSIVADSYNIERFVTEYTANLKDQIMHRWKTGQGFINRTIIRPDSLRDENDTPTKQVIWLHEELAEIFGYTTNDKGYKVLHPCIGVLWGDGINDEQLEEIYNDLASAGWSVESLAVGQGGGLLNAGELNTRDTNRFAIKCSAQRQDNQWVDIQKNPLDQTKKSKTGRLILVKDMEKYRTVSLNGFDYDEQAHGLKDEMVTVFEDGEIKVEYDLEQIRKRVKEQNT